MLPNFARCFQLMECDDLRLFQAWIAGGRGLGVAFEIGEAAGLSLAPSATSAMAWARRPYSGSERVTTVTQRSARAAN